MDLIKINIGGTNFLTSRETILKVPQSTLANALVSHNHYDRNLGAYYFDRRPELFGIILQGHREGVIHLPSECCGNELINEMEFWNIPERMIAPCCAGKVRAAECEREIAESVERDILGHFDRCMKIIETSRGWRRGATRLWVFLEFPVSSIQAKLYSIVLSVFVLLSILMLYFNLDMSLREPSSGNQTRVSDDVAATFDTEKWRRLTLQPANRTILTLEACVNIPILMDQVIRILVCPCKARFFKSIKLADTVIVFGFWISFAMFVPPYLAGIRPSKSLHWIWLGTSLFQLLRPLLILRLANTFVGLRVLLMVLVKSFVELFTIVAFLGIGMLFFGFCIFVAEIGVKGSFMTPWEGCWWALITMTTIGYGDMYPHRLAGYIVGGGCALTGVILTGLSIPILSCNFHSYYDHCQAAVAKIQERVREMRERRTVKVGPLDRK